MPKNLHIWLIVWAVGVVALFGWLVVAGQNARQAEAVSSGPQCDVGYRAALRLAEREGRTSDLAKLKSLAPIPLYADGDGNKVLCQVWIPSDLTKSDWGFPTMGPPPSVKVGVIGPTTMEGWLSPVGYLTMAHRNNPYAPFDSYASDGLDVEQYSHLIDRSTQPIRYLLDDAFHGWRNTASLSPLEYWFYRAAQLIGILLLPGFLLLPILIGGSYVEARRSGRAETAAVAEAFMDAALDQSENVFHIGGVSWMRAGGDFFHAHLSFNGVYRTQPNPNTGSRQRAGYEQLFQLMRPVSFAVSIALTPALLISDALHMSAVDFSTLCWHCVCAVLSLLAAWSVVRWERYYRSGRQTAWGAKVLDPDPGMVGQMTVREQRALGSARLATEDEVNVAAARGGAPRSTIHEQKF